MEVPDCVLAEYAKAMSTKYGVELSTSYLSQFLQKRNINKKKVSHDVMLTY